SVRWRTHLEQPCGSTAATKPLAAARVCVLGAVADKHTNLLRLSGSGTPPTLGSQPVLRRSCSRGSKILRKRPAVPARRPPPLATRAVRQQPIRFSLDHRIAFAAKLFELRSIQDGDLPARVADGLELLQLTGRFGHPFAAHAEHIGDEFLRHRQLVRGETI